MRNNKIEAIAVSYMIQSKSTNLIDRYGYSYKDFTGSNREIVKDMLEHKDKYGVIPDEDTIIYKFGDKYSSIPITESPMYIEDALKDYVTYNRLANFFDENQRKLTGTTEEMEQAMRGLVDLVGNELSNTGGTTQGTDITKDKSRLEEYTKRVSGEGEPLYSYGIPALDGMLGGLLPDDLVAIFARPAVGKSYILTLISQYLYRQGLNVLFYSGEMEATQVGYRFDSMIAHVSNSDLLMGRGFKEGEVGLQEYENHLKGMENFHNYFTVVHPIDFGGRRPTVNDFEDLIDKLNPDVLVVDQLSLVDSSKKSKDIRTETIDIMRDLRTLTDTRRIPTLVAVQANRQATQKNEEGEFELPELHHLAESDAVGQFATRAISLASKEAEVHNSRIMKLGIKKNRHGKYGEARLLIDFDKGKVEELPDDDVIMHTEKEVPF